MSKCRFCDNDSHYMFADGVRCCKECVGIAADPVAEIDRLRSVALHESECVAAAKEEIDRLRAEVAALREDAERYRWLRAQHWKDGLLAVVACPKDSVKLGRDCPSLERLDEQIDCAIATATNKPCPLCSGSGTSSPSQRCICTY